MKRMIAVIVTGFLLAGCAGKTPNPIRTHHPSDAALSCSALQAEMDEMDQRMRELLPQSEKMGKNVGLGIAGAFLFVPWFFMDFSDAERVEIEAFRTRYNYLTRVYNEKRCGLSKEEIPGFTAVRKK